MARGSARQVDNPCMAKGYPRYIGQTVIFHGFQHVAESLAVIHGTSVSYPRYIGQLPTVHRSVIHGTSVRK